MMYATSYLKMMKRAFILKKKQKNLKKIKTMFGCEVL